MEDWGRWRNNRNRLPNLQLLEGRSNGSKNAISLLEYYNDMNEEQKNVSTNTDDSVILMAVAFNESKNTYIVDLAKGSNVAETAFAMTVVIKCLLKDGVIKSASDVTDLINKYMNDPQYDEVKENDN